ncbi:MAG: hypothetical protein WAK31_04545 [Chthoniobacterales bacterium]
MMVYDSIMPDVPLPNLSSGDNAEGLLRSLRWAYEGYQKALPGNRRAVIRASSNGVTIRMEGAQWINPATIIFSQHPKSKGEALKVIVQHVSQLNILLDSEEIVKNEKPRPPIGFGPAE